MKRLLALFLILIGAILPNRLATATPKVATPKVYVHGDYYKDYTPLAPADVMLLWINGTFGALVMIGFGVSSFILALVAIQAPARRRGWVIASIFCALLAIGSFVLRSLQSLNL